MSLAKMDDVVAANSINSKTDETICHENTSCCATLDENPSCKFELKQCFPCVFDPLGYFVKDRLPFLGWLGVFECFRWCNGVIKWLSKRVPRFPNCGKVYNFRTGVADLVAGVTVGIMVVPQALAYAKIATLPIEYGLFSAFMGVFVYALFGTSKDVTLGPTAILSLITASAISSCTDKVACATLLTFLCGMIQLVLGIFNLGFLIDFIPLPVISGFVSAASITIAGGQLKHLIGVKTSGHRPIFDFVISMKETLWQIPYLNKWDLLLGAFCIVLVVFLQLFKTHNEKIFKRLERPNLLQKIVHKMLWLLCTARNGVVVFIGALIGLAVWYRPCTYGSCDKPLTYVDYTENNTPSFQLPPFDGGMIGQLGVGIAMAPLIGFLETIAISKAFARQNGYTINPTQELIAIGLANVASSFVGSYPVTGSFSRTAVNSQSGVQTPAAGIYTGCVVLLAIYFLGPAFDFIPATALAAIIIPAVLFTFDWRIVWSIFIVRKIDLIPLVVSFIGTLVFGVEYGVPAACLLYILMLLYREARIRHRVVRYDCGILCLELNGGWNYPSVNYIWNRVYAEINSQEDLEGGKRLRAVVFNCASMPEVDYTTIMGFKDGAKDLKRRGLQLFIIGAQDHVINMLHKADKDLNIYPSLSAVLEFLGDSDNENIGESTGLLSSSKK